MTEFMHHDQVATPRSRRAIVKGAAWSRPVIAAAVAAPAASASIVLPEQATNLHFVSIIWNDGANGSNANGSLDDRWYPAGFKLYFDTTFTNNGSSIISGIQFQSSLETLPHDFATNPPVTQAIYNGTSIAPSSTQPGYDQGGLGDRWVNPSRFDALTLAPGETIVFRTTYYTTTTPGINKVGAPYGIASVTSALPTDSENFTASQQETLTSDNYGSVPNPYNVRT